MSNTEWYTPSRYIEAARTVMSTIDLDPASCAQANETVKATEYFTKEDNGLLKGWHGNIWINPPYGKTNNKGNIGLFVGKLLQEYDAGTISQAVLLCTTRNDRSWFRRMWEFPICFADHEVKFRRPGLEDKDQMHGTIFVYLGPHRQRFIDVFSQFGTVAGRLTPSSPKVSHSQSAFSFSS